MILDAESIEAVARRVLELQREQATALTQADPWLTRQQAEAYLGVSRKGFWRLRAEHPALAPCSIRPLRWSKRNLDGWKLSQSLPKSSRRSAA